ncbi:MAG: hypothetical protein LBQ61_03570 [Spirochaetales bacterium]|jgi:hypothetical protein|nr:hypothetical protein [Spirochaetales bacterium]
MTDELREILENNGLREYINIFTKHKILDVDIVSELSEIDLEKIGVQALGDRKKIIKLFSSAHNPPAQTNQGPSNSVPSEFIIHHAAKTGNDVKTGLGRGFGETVGKKAGGCAWSIGVLVVIVIVIFIIFMSAF